MPAVYQSATRLLSIQLLALGCLVAGAPIAAPSANAQFESNPIDADAKRLGSTRAKRYARSPSGDQADRTAFGNYIVRYYLPAMTQDDPASLAGLSKMRSDFMRSYLWGAAPAVQADLTKVTYAEMTKVVQGRYHPAVRYNAMLLIGQLDAEYSKQNSVPKPLPKANEYLTRYVSGGINTEKAPAPLVIGAIIGLERHAKALSGLPAANRSATASALLAVLEKDEFPQEMAPSVAQWMKVLAARGLAGVGVLGDGNKVHLAMMDIIADEKARLNTRVRVAELLESYSGSYGSASGINEKETVQTLMQLATDIVADENERALDYERDAIGGSGGGSRQPYGQFDNADLPSDYQIRRVVLRLTGLKKGINAVKPAIKDPKLAGMLSEVVTAIDPVIATATDRKVIELNLTKQIKQMASSVSETTASLGVEAVEAPPESDEEAAEELLEEEAAEAADAPAA